MQRNAFASNTRIDQKGRTKSQRPVVCAEALQKSTSQSLERTTTAGVKIHKCDVNPCSEWNSDLGKTIEHRTIWKLSHRNCQHKFTVNRQRSNLKPNHHKRKAVHSWKCLLAKSMHQIQLRIHFYQRQSPIRGKSQVLTSRYQMQAALNYQPTLLLGKLAPLSGKSWRNP